MSIVQPLTVAKSRQRDHVPIRVIAILFAALPILVGGIYRTYSISMSPAWVETIRQLGIAFVLAEVAIVMYARHMGLRWRPYWDGLQLSAKAALAVFLGTFWISSVFVSPMPAVSTFLTLTWVIHIGFAVATHYLVGRLSRADMAVFATIVLIGFTLYLPMIAVHFGFHPPAHRVPGGWLDWGSAIPGFISHRLFGAYAGALAALALGMAWVFDPGGRKGWLAYGLLTVCLAAAIWSGTRAAVVGLVAAIFIGAFFTRRRPSNRFLLMAPLCCAIATLVALLLVPDDGRFLLYVPADSASAEAMTGGRLSFWSATWHAYLETPLFGSGSASTFWLVGNDGARHVQPHNLILQFLLSWGLIATVPALFLLAVAAWRVHQIARMRTWILPIVLLLDCLLTISFFDGTLYFPRFVMLIIAAFALCFAAEPAPKETRAA